MSSNLSRGTRCTLEGAGVGSPNCLENSGSPERAKRSMRLTLRQERADGHDPRLERPRRYAAPREIGWHSR